MNYHGRSRVNANNPQAQAVCDRCGMWYNHVDLRMQYEWGGLRLVSTGMLVCKGCYDVPNEQLRARNLPPDPIPILNPRPERAGNQSYDYRVTEVAEDLRITDDDDDRILEGDP